MQDIKVLIDIEDFNHLKDFEQNVKSGKYFTIIEDSLNPISYRRTRYFTNDEIVQRITHRNKSLVKEIETLRGSIQQLELDKKETIAISEKDSIPYLKKMSYLEFCQWRKS